MRIGTLEGTAIVLDDAPGDEGLEMFFGTDDENYGGSSSKTTDPHSRLTNSASP